MQESGSGWALVTGASSGLGTALAEALAARRSNLVLVARRAAPMEQLAARLRAAHGVEVTVESLDLAEPGATRALERRLDARGLVVDVLVNNAGAGLHGRLAEQDPERLRAMLQLDVVALTELTHAFGRGMLARGRGHVLLVASLAAYQPAPLYAAYAAAKAYVLSLGEALHAEFAPRVGVTVLSPGLMDTEFLSAAGQGAMTPLQRRTLLPPATVARIGLDALYAGRSSVVAGRLNRMMAFATRLTPRRWQAQAILRAS